MIPFSARAALAVAFCAIASVTGAQQRPTSGDAERMLQSNPALVEQLRQRIATSGLTPDQVRARLRAEGYPEDLLDAYLGGPVRDSLTPPSADVYSAVTALGLGDAMEVQLLECGVDPQSLEFRGTGTTDPRFALITRAELDSLRGPRDTSRAGRREMDMRKRQLLTLCRARMDSLARGELQRRMEADSGLVIFGLETFRRPTTLFEANEMGPVDANYRLGPGDQLVLVLSGDVEASYTLDVTREGMIFVPAVGQLAVNNLTMEDLENLLYSRLGRVYSGVRRGPGATTRFHVTPARLRSNQISVHGDVMVPGSHRISSAGTAMTALYAAGGPTENGSMRRVMIRRGGRTVETLDVYDYLLRGDASRDVRLQNGDVVFVPIHGPRVRMVGEVPRPATYEMVEGETLADAIRFAGGYKPAALRTRVQIERILPPAERAPGRDRVITDIMSEELEAAFGPVIPVRAGDVIRIFSVTSPVRNRVVVTGNVWTPGPQGITPGVTRLSDVIRAAGGVKPDTYLGQVLIARVYSDSTREMLRTALADTLGRPNPDILVREDDNITIFSRTEFAEERYVAINGAVNRGGRFPYREGMTIRDLVLMAGGLQQSALITEAELARLPESRQGGRTAQTFRVPLDSSYIFERAPDGRYLGPPGLPAPAGNMPDVALQPYDNVLILRQPDWELERRAVIAGEVRYPGMYTLRTKTERVADLVRRAGGLTSEGHADGVVFYRTMADVGRIGIELPSVLRSGRHPDNLILQDGDSIFIPRYSGVVHVEGHVNSPVAVSYVPGQALEFYVRAAGGPAARADLSRAYVTQPNGKVEAVTKRPFAPDTHPRPRAGSTVYVPQRDPADIGPNYIGALTTMMQVISGLIATVAIVRTL